MVSLFGQSHGTTTVHATERLPAPARRQRRHTAPEWFGAWFAELLNTYVEAERGATFRVSRTQC